MVPVSKLWSNNVTDNTPTRLVGPGLGLGDQKVERGADRTVLIDCEHGPVDDAEGPDDAEAGGLGGKALPFFRAAWWSLFTMTQRMYP
jgi:hypothetical protein